MGKQLDTAEEPNLALHLLAPVLAIGATMVARKVLDTAFRGVTGHEPPDARDPGTRMRTAIMWAALTAATAAVVEVGVYRLTSRD